MLELATVFFGSVLLAGLFQIYIRPGAGDVLMASLIFVPVLLYIVGDRNLTELSGFGFAAKFEEAGGRRLDDVFETQIAEELPASLTSVSPNELAAYFQACEPHFIIRTDGVPDWRGDEVDPYVVFVTEAIRASLACGRLVGVVILDGEDRYVGSYDAGFFQEALSLWTIPAGTPVADVAEAIRSRTIFGTALVHPTKRLVPGEGYVAAINEQATLLEAFERFNAMNGDMLVVTDALGRIRGILERQDVADEILGRVIASLSGAE